MTGAVCKLWVRGAIAPSLFEMWIMRDVKVVTVDEPLRKLPSDVRGKQIALKMTGGVGDCLMAIGGSAKLLSSQGATCSAVVRDHQFSLMSELVGVSKCVGVPEFNNLDVQHSFDVIIDFKGTFNRSHELIDEEYYTAVGRRLGRSVGVGEFKFKHFPIDDLAVLHPGASNPNRRWVNAKWSVLAYELRNRGFRVVWLGTKDEYGFVDTDVSKLSDIVHDLKVQSEVVASAKLFVGCDSGFAHIAGMLGVTGVVLFGNTDAKNVIHRYASLVGVDALNGQSPTRSLKADCEKSIQGMLRIEVGAVLDALKVSQMPCTARQQSPRCANRFKVQIRGTVSRDVVESLIYRYDVVHGMAPIGWNPDAVIVVTDKMCRMQVGEANMAVRLDAESIVRALRETIS